MDTLDYLVIGTITADLSPAGPVPGGTVTYSGRTAAALGLQTAVLTTAGPEVNMAAWLPGLSVTTVPAAETTTFTNAYAATGRIQTIHKLASPLRVADLPADWSEPAIVHLGPLVREVDPAFVQAFPNSLVGMTPQGWMRAWDEHGVVSACDWAEAEATLPHADVVILSTEDLLDDQMLVRFRALSRLLILTRSAEGCLLFSGAEEYAVPAPAVTECNPTGAGDIFAAAFLTYYWRTGGNLLQAADYANQVAAQTVTVESMEEKMALVTATGHQIAAHQHE